MLKETSAVRRIPGEHRRRRFSCETLGLIVWLDGGEGRAFRHKGTPILAPDGRFDAARVFAPTPG